MRSSSENATRNPSTIVAQFRTFAVAAAALAFLLAVLGSWVRINGAGMTCPDWPLCKGSLIPTLQGGVILEWGHRLVAMIEGFVLIGALFTGWRSQLLVAGVRPVLAALGVIFVVQIALGGLTVQLSNRPDSVVWHWATAMALLAALTVLAVLAVLQPRRAPRISTAVLALAGTAAAAFAAMAAGAYVSSSGAGLACPNFPSCGTSHFWGAGSLQMAQMMHRSTAAVFALCALAGTALIARAPGNARIFAGLGVFCMIDQIALGVANVVWQLPTALREAHAANAAATFLLFVIAAAIAAIEATPKELVDPYSTLRGSTGPVAARVHGALK